MEYCKKFRNLSPIKEVPKNHSIQSRYSSYDRVNDYVRHITKVFDNALNKSAEYDSSCIESINFKSKLPQINAKFKNSSFPSSQVSPEVTEKIALVNAYNNLCEMKVSKSKSRAKSNALQEEKGFKHRNELVCITGKMAKVCFKCNLSNYDCRCFFIPSVVKRRGEIDSPLSAELYQTKKKVDISIRSMNSSYSLSAKKQRNKLSFSFEDSNFTLLSRYLNK